MSCCLASGVVAARWLYMLVVVFAGLGRFSLWMVFARLPGDGLTHSLLLRLCQRRLQTIHPGVTEMKGIASDDVAVEMMVVLWLDSHRQGHPPAPTRGTRLFLGAKLEWLAGLFAFGFQKMVSIRMQSIHLTHTCRPCSSVHTAPTPSSSRVPKVGISGRCIAACPRRSPAHSPHHIFQTAIKAMQFMSVQV
jgi:hypothetical protein